MFSNLQIANLPVVDRRTVLSTAELPGLSSILMLDAVIAKVQISLDEIFTKAMVNMFLILYFNLFK